MRVPIILYVVCQKDNCPVLLLLLSVTGTGIDKYITLRNVKSITNQTDAGSHAINMRSLGVALNHSWSQQ